MGAGCLVSNLSVDLSRCSQHFGGAADCGEHINFESADMRVLYQLAGRVYLH